MELPSFSRVEAIHPHWTGFLRLSNTDNRVQHESNGSNGTYEQSGQTLTVHWAKYGPDVFLMLSGVYVHRDLVKAVPELMRLFAVTVRNKAVIATKISVMVPGSDYEVSLRLRTTDIPTFEQIFVRREYESPNLPDSAKAIVDLGANIGLATVFFGIKYPQAKILCVEPGGANFTATGVNTAPLGDRVRKEHAAVWTRDGLINLHMENENGSALGAWGIQVSDQKGKSNETVKCCTIRTLLDRAGFDSVDILKVDIEGAELEVFSCDAKEWLPRINLIVVETHDRFRPGSDEAVRKAVHPMFEELPKSGENLFFRRIST